jgi:hypothetical protein
VRLREKLRVLEGYAQIHLQRGEWRDCLEVSRSILRECEHVLSPEERSRVQDRVAHCGKAVGDDPRAASPARVG